MILAPALGLLGGTFDPIHYGHLELAREVLAAQQLAGMTLIPAGDPPHRGAPLATADDRLAMVRIAVRDYPGLAVDAREVRRAGRSYTVLTLEELRAEDPERPLALVIGADAFLGLTTWHRWHEIFDLAHMIVVARPGVACEGVLPPPLMHEWQRRLTSAPDALRATPAGAIVRQPITPHPISASAIRAAIARGDSAAAAGLLPPAVLAYIESHRLYRAGQDAT